METVFEIHSKPLILLGVSGLC